MDSSNTILSGIDWGAVIAPYWYDVDTRGNGSGRIYYKDVTRDTGADLIGEIDSLATSHLCEFIYYYLGSFCYIRPCRILNYILVHSGVF